MNGFGIAIAATIALSLAGCSNESKKAAVQDPSCSSQSAEALRDDEPRGTCMQGAECRFSIPPGRCEPGQFGVDVLPSIFHCDCPQGTWACRLEQGSLTFLLCPDAPDADAPDVVSGDASTGDAS